MSEQDATERKASTGAGTSGVLVKGGNAFFHLDEERRRQVIEKGLSYCAGDASLEDIAQWIEENGPQEAELLRQSMKAAILLGGLCLTRGASSKAFVDDLKWLGFDEEEIELADRVHRLGEDRLSDRSGARDEGDTEGERERDAFEIQLDVEAAYFQRIKPSLLSDPVFRGRFVAIHDKRIIDVDDDEFALAERACAQVPDVPIFIGKVVSEEPVIEMSSPEVEW